MLYTNLNNNVIIYMTWKDQFAIYLTIKNLVKDVFLKSKKISSKL